MAEYPVSKRNQRNIAAVYQMEYLGGDSNNAYWLSDCRRRGLRNVQKLEFSIYRFVHCE